MMGCSKLQPISFKHICTMYDKNILSKQEEERVAYLMKELEKVHAREAVISKELRALIYKIERVR